VPDPAKTIWDAEGALALAAALREAREVTDREFDRLFPREQRPRSVRHWTPLSVARRACELLAPRAGMRVLDVGSGVGKLCLVGAVTTSAAWVGIEVDERMVAAAAHAARLLGVAERVELVHGDAHAIDWTPFDAVYMFNPFAEGLLDRSATRVVRRAKFLQEVESAQAKLATLRTGTRLVTLHGFGRDTPEGFDLELDEKAHDDHLCVWIRS
jgi:SAM-dependent methyltransferase